MVSDGADGKVLTYPGCCMRYIQLFIRGFKKSKLFTLLNLFGLTLGLSAFIYMNSYIQFERSYEDFNNQASRIYRVTSQKTQHNEVLERKSSGPVILKDHVLRNHAEIEKATRINLPEAKRLIVRVEGHKGDYASYIETRGFHAESDFFDLFGSPLVSGNPQTALDGPNKVVLTKSTSRKYFGDLNPIGRTVTISDDFEMEYMVTGLMDDAPKNSHFQYDLLISFDTFIKQRPHWRWEAWDWDYFHTYIKIKDGIDPVELERSINASVAKSASEQFSERGYTLDLTLQNIADIHLNSKLGRELSINGNGELLGYLEVIAYFILWLAWINYINLSTAIANRRAKEVGVRKIVGANKFALTFQFLSEALIYNVIAIIASFGLIYLVNPVLSDVTGYLLDGKELMTLEAALFTALTLFIGTLGAGLYPAFVLSNIEALKVLRGNYSSSKQGLLVRKGLVVFQFTMALILMVLTAGIYQQVSFMRTRELGVNIDKVLIANMPNVRGESFWRDFDSFKNQLKQRTYVSHVTTSSEIPGTYLNMVESFKQKSQSPEEAQILKFVWVDYDYFDLYDLQFAAGGPFVEENQSDVRDGVIFTEEAVKRLGFANAQDAVHQPVDWVRNSGDLDPFRVVGVVKDFEQEANNAPQAIIYIMNRRWSSWFVTNFIAIKLDNSTGMTSQIDEIRAIHSSIYKSDSFDYFFQDDHYNKAYQADMKFGKIFAFFSMLTLCITLLGLVGLTAFLVISKKREVGIRRVLGATFNDLFISFSKEYLFQMGLAALISFPLAYVILTRWMDKFIAKMEIGHSIFVFPVIVLVCMTMTVLIYHLLQITKHNPAEVVRGDS